MSAHSEIWRRKTVFGFLKIKCIKKIRRGFGCRRAKDIVTRQESQ
jgi:hypothetical protein